MEPTHRSHAIIRCLGHDMGCLRLVGSLKLQVSFANVRYKRDDILQKRPIIVRSLLTVATPCPVILEPRIFFEIQIYDRIISGPAKQQDNKLWLVQEIQIQKRANVHVSANLVDDLVQLVLNWREHTRFQTLLIDGEQWFCVAYQIRLVSVDSC